MTDTFAALKRNRTEGFANLTTEINKLNSPQKQQNGPDDRFWKPEVDKAGNGYAVIRFLPEPENEDVPFVRVWDHGFQGPGGWFIENSLTTLGQKCPMSEYNSMLWNTGIEANKDQVRKQKRRLNYISNIQVINDSSNPDNNGKVFLYKFGKKISDKIKDAMQPEFQDEDPMNPFDFWDGANFKLKIRQVEGYRNYDKSEFSAVSPVSDSDEEIEAIWGKQHSLAEMVDPKNFKTYDELKAKLNQVLTGGAKVTTAESISATTGDLADDAFLKDVTTAVESRQQTASAVVDDTDDTMSYFAKLAQDY